MSELKEKAIKAAEKFLERRGYEVIESNWKSEGGNSLDLVAREDDTVVFVDVYARHGFDKGMPEEGNEALANAGRSPRRLGFRSTQTTPATSTSRYVSTASR